jgi:pimeloyl-ACP methyl ester carboxylesterase
MKTKNLSMRIIKPVNKAFFVMLLLLSLVVLLIAGCSQPYSARPLSILKIFEERHQSALDSSEPGWQTEQQLRLLFLDEQYKKDPLSVITKLYNDAYASQDKDLMKVAAELSLLNARKTYAKDKATSTALYLHATELAYDYLFSSDSFAPENVLTPSHRFMADIYNRSVSRLIEIRSKHQTPWPDTLSRTVGDRNYELTIEKQGRFLWDPTLFDQLIPANQLKIKGLRNEYIQKGLGAPLVGMLENPKEHPELGTKLPTQGVTFPVTAVLTFGSRDILDSKPYRRANLAFYDSMQTANVLIEGKQVRLEADYSTPLGLMLARMESKGGGLAGMFESDEYANFAGIYMLERISLKKTPVVMVHGLMSSPETWVEMFNDLRGKREIRENYQFWFFKYPTGLPVAYSSSILRKQLLEIYSEYDPERQNPYFNNMVVVSHSMGGLLARTVVQDSKDIFWDSLFTKPIDTISMNDEDKEFLRDVLFFDQMSFVKRVVFISTPHKGSDLADKWFAKMAAGMIHLPGTVTNITKEIVSVGQEELAIDKSKFSKRAPNALDNLSPSSTFTKVTNQIPLANDVPYHSVIGTRRSKTGPGSSDGIVPYWSSHLDITVSEVLVPSGHGAHRHPIAIAEIKRILQMHLQSNEINSIEE